MANAKEAKEAKELEKLAGPKFNKTVKQLNKDCDAAVAEATQNLGKIDAMKIPVPGKDKSKYDNLKARTISHRKLFLQEMNAVWSKKAKSPKRVYALYDDYCLNLATLQALNDQWSAFFAVGFISAFLGGLDFLLIARESLKKHAGELEKSVADLQKELKKAEKEEFYGIIKNGIGYAWTAANICIPQLRAMSALSKLATGAIVAFSADGLFGSKEDFAKDAVGTVMGSGTLISEAKGFLKVADGFGAAGLALKLVNTKGSLDGMADARSKVEKIAEKIKAVEQSVRTLIRKYDATTATTIRTKGQMISIQKKMRVQVNKGRDANKLYKSLLALRKKA